MSIHVDRRFQFVTLENDIDASFLLVHSNIDHFLLVYCLWPRWITVCPQIFISAEATELSENPSPVHNKSNIKLKPESVYFLCTLHVQGGSNMTGTDCGLFTHK
jgi:hypothetical protein